MTMTQDEIVRLANNPERGVNRVINDIETRWFDKQVYINSKTHPLVFAIDLIIGTTHGVLNRVEDNISKLFPAHARNISELSRHMSDEEKFGMFGTPSSSMSQYAIEENTFQSLAKDITVVQGKVTFTYKLLRLPKDSEFTVAGYTFAIENGVEIRYSDKTGYQIVYDETTNNPYQPISNNLLKREFREIDGRFYIVIDIPVRQLHCLPTENITSNVSSGCNGFINYADDLYGVRAFLIPEGSSTPVEIKVNYDQDIFDPMTPTLALTLDTTNKQFKYEIPDVYIANGLGLGILRVYTYTTRGSLVKDFTDTDLSSILVNYQDYRYGAGKLDSYSSPLKDSSGIVWRLSSVTSGGSNSLPFLEIKRRFIEGRRRQVLPITENNLEGLVESSGYSSVKTIDYLTKRSFALTKELPVQDNKKFFSPMLCYVGSHLASANDMIASGIVIDNGERVTIPHNVLFNISKPTSVLVNQITKDRYASMRPEQIADLVNSTAMVYTPFYYVLDMTINQAVLRTYHLDQPRIEYQNFKSENTALGIEVGVGSIDVEHRDTGYVITIVTQSGSSYKELENESLGIQLSVNPQDTNSLASMAGVLVGMTDEDERIFEFHLNSKFDVDINDVIYFTNFNQFGSEQINTGVPLSLDMTFIFVNAGDNTATETDSDKKIDTSIFPVPMIAIIETAYTVNLGRKLGNLYSRIRPLVGEAQYKRYPQDVPATHQVTTYQRDRNGEYIFDPEGNRLIENRVGDIIKTSSGQTVLEYQANDVVFEDGKPVVLAPRDLKYHWDFLAFDGAYYFSKDPYDLEFAADTKNFFINNITRDMEGFAESAIDQTSLVYQPRNKLGFQKVLVNSNYAATLRQDLRFTVTYYLTRGGYKNINLKNNLTASTPRTLNEALFNATTVGGSELSKLLKENASADVVDVKITSWAGDVTVDVISNADSLTGFSIARLLSLGGDGLLTVREAVDVLFLPHDRTMVDLGPV